MRNGHISVEHSAMGAKISVTLCLRQIFPNNMSFLCFYLVHVLKGIGILERLRRILTLTSVRCK